MVPEDSPDVPRPRILVPKDTATLLRQHLLRHNRQVILLSLVTFIAALLLWALLYGVLCWLLLLGFSVFDVPHPQIPRGLPILYAVTAVCMVLYESIDQRLTPNQRVRDRKPPLEVFSDFVLVLPRITLSIPGTLSAWCRLTPLEFQQAAALLHRVATHAHTPLSTMPLDIPEERSRNRILLTLQILQIIDLKREDHDFILKLNPLRPPDLGLTAEGYA